MEIKSWKRGRKEKKIRRMVKVLVEWKGNGRKKQVTECEQ
jgi:hypothetical protein